MEKNLSESEIAAEARIAPHTHGICTDIALLVLVPLSMDIVRLVPDPKGEALKGRSPFKLYNYPLSWERGLGVWDKCQQPI